MKVKTHSWKQLKFGQQSRIWVSEQAPVLLKNVFWPFFPNTPKVLSNNLIHMQPHMQAVRRRQLHAQAGGENITSKSKDTLARNGLTTTVDNNGAASEE